MFKKIFLSSFLFLAGFALTNNASADSSLNSRLEVPYSTIFSQAVGKTDVSNYSCVSVHTLNSGTGSVLTFQQSNDGIHWVGQPLGYEQGTAGAAALNYSTSSAGHVFFGSLTSRYFQLNVTGISAGTTSGIIEFFSNCRTPSQSLVSATQLTSLYTTATTPLTEASTVVGNSTATATLNAASGAYTYISGFQITGTGATVAATVTCTVTGVVNQMYYLYTVPTGASLAATPLIVTFSPPLQSTATNTAISVSCPSTGAAGYISINSQGFRQ